MKIKMNSRVIVKDTETLIKFETDSFIRILQVSEDETSKLRWSRDAR